MAGLSLADIEQVAKKVRKMKIDLVIIAVPSGAMAENTEKYIRHYFWIINWSLGYSNRSWDVIGIPPSVTHPDLNPEQRKKDRLEESALAELNR